MFKLRKERQLINSNQRNQDSCGHHKNVIQRQRPDMGNRHTPNKEHKITNIAMKPKATRVYNCKSTLKLYILLTKCTFSVTCKFVIHAWFKRISVWAPPKKKNLSYKHVRTSPKLLTWIVLLSLTTISPPPKSYVMHFVWENVH